MDMPLPDWAPRGADAPALSIVVPVYNGAATVGALVAALETLEVPGGLEIVLVNDGSPDDSGAVCRALLGRSAVPITYVEHARNYGEHNAVMTGLRHARGAYVITMDDDLQNPPEEVVRLFLHTRDGGYDVVYTRYAEKKHEGRRNLGSRFANRVADILIDKPRGLYLSSFRCMSRVVVDGVDSSSSCAACSSRFSRYRCASPKVGWSTPSSRSSTSDAGTSSRVSSEVNSSVGSNHRKPPGRPLKMTTWSSSKVTK